MASEHSKGVRAAARALHIEETTCTAEPDNAMCEYDITDKSDIIESHTHATRLEEENREMEGLLRRVEAACWFVATSGNAAAVKLHADLVALLAKLDADKEGR